MYFPCLMLSGELFRVYENEMKFIDFAGLNNALQHLRDISPRPRTRKGGEALG